MKKNAYTCQTSQRNDGSDGISPNQFEPNHNLHIRFEKSVNKMDRWLFFDLGMKPSNRPTDCEQMILVKINGNAHTITSNA